MANVEAIKRSWEDEKRGYEYESAEDGLSHLFDSDHSDDLARIQSLDLAHLDHAVEHVSATLDSSSIVAATVGGALAGGITGGAFGAVVTLLGR